MARVLKSEEKREEIVYPDSDGVAMADNTEQFEWIVMIKEGLELMFADREDVFIAGDLLWYPVEGDNKTRIAPDAMVVFGRPKGRRGSYKQWLEDDIAPQVVFEVLSPGNRASEMIKKLQFYDHYGVDEYYIIDPDRNSIDGLIRTHRGLEPIAKLSGWTSPLLKIKFLIENALLCIYRPDGQKFESYVQIAQRLEHNLSLERQRAELEHQRAELERQRAELEHQRAELEQKRAERLAEKLREMGIDPKDI